MMLDYQLEGSHDEYRTLERTVKVSLVAISRKFVFKFSKAVD